MLAIDIRFLGVKDGEVQAGVDLFCVQILKEIQKNSDINNICIVTKKSDLDFVNKEFPEMRKIVFDRIPLQTTISLIKKINQLRYQHSMKKNSVDKIWYPYFNLYYAYKTDIKSIYQVHDLIPLHENPDNEILKVKTCEYLCSAEGITTSSEYVKADIVKTCGVDPLRIRVIYNPIEIDIHEKEELAELKNKSFILDINSYQNRKNPYTLLKAFREIHNEISMDLVFCGGFNEDNVMENLKSLSKKWGIESKVHFFLKIPFRNRNWLLDNCSLLVSPSLSEGFGRTPIEAALCEKPVISTKVDSLYEVTKGLLNYYDNPMDEEELANKIIDVIKKMDDKEELARISDILKNEYQPSKIANEYYDLLTSDGRK
jgi:glycosyltransferase involved in cell wall biosynthesis